MAQGEAAAALKEYETSLKNAPMRLRGFYGAAKAAEASGDAKKSRTTLDASRRISRDTEAGIPHLEARARALNLSKQRAWRAWHGLR